MLQQLESLFDKPKVIEQKEQQAHPNQRHQSSNLQQTNQSRMQPDQSQQTNQTNDPNMGDGVGGVDAGRQSVTLQSNRNAQNAYSSSKYMLEFERDIQNTFLITNPTVIFRLFNQSYFMNLDEDSQTLLVERLDEILTKCSLNGLVLSEQTNLQNISRTNQIILKKYLQKDPTPEQTKEIDQQIANSLGQNQDVLFQLIWLGLLLAAQSDQSDKQTATAYSLVAVVKKISCGRRFQKCHVQLIYQFLKSQMQRLSSTGQQSNQLDQKHSIIMYSMTLLQGLLEQQRVYGPKSFFYFSGFLSGILLNTKQINQWPFVKGFAVAMWFQIHERSIQIQDDNNLPVLFNCFSNGFGGFECYFNKNKLFYRILARFYSPPTVNSNGVEIGEFEPNKWYLLGLEHDKPFLSRAQLIAVINERQVINIPIDYPKFEKNAKFTMAYVCKDFVGQMSTFMLFREQINNSKKFVQMQKAYQYGISSSKHLKNLDQDVFEQKLMDKLLLMYTPIRVQNKIAFDCIGLNDGELLINSGVSSGPSISKQILLQSGNLVSMLPMLEQTLKLARLMENQNSGDQSKVKIYKLVDQFLQLVVTAMSSKKLDQNDPDCSQFFKLLFHIIGQFPSKLECVSTHTVQLLAEIRFSVGNKQLNEEFFLNLLFTADYWINTGNEEVMNEYWQFVKAIYSQNPVQYNKVFPVHHLIDLMVKISDIGIGAFCCEYHKNSYLMFYKGETIQNTFSKSDNEFVNIVAKDGQQSYTEDIIQLKSQKSLVQSTSSPQVYRLNQVLEPIAGVLESIFISGGEEILDQIECIARSLIVKSSPCLHLQMLKLLKLLLLDSRDDLDCVSPIQFSSKFLNAKGLQILLYLCSNSSFDVKAMCIKLIDVLSSHTSLIKMRIDTDLITFLCHIILPQQMIEGKQFQDLVTKQHHQMENINIQVTHQPEKEDSIDNQTSPYKIDGKSPPKKSGVQFFSYGEVQTNDQQQPQNLQISTKKQGFSLDLVNENDDEEQNEEVDNPKNHHFNDNNDNHSEEENQQNDDYYDAAEAFKLEKEAFKLQMSTTAKQSSKKKFNLMLGLDQEQEQTSNQFQIDQLEQESEAKFEKPKRLKKGEILQQQLLEEMARQDALEEDQTGEDNEDQQNLMQNEPMDNSTNSKFSKTMLGTFGIRGAGKKISLNTFDEEDDGYMDNFKDQGPTNNTNNFSMTQLNPIGKSGKKLLLELGEEEERSNVFQRQKPSQQQMMNFDLSDEEQNSQEEDDDKSPKMTKEILMSKGLRDKKNTGFNFAFDGDDDDSDEENNDEEQEEEMPEPPMPRNLDDEDEESKDPVMFMPPQTKKNAQIKGRAKPMLNLATHEKSKGQLSKENLLDPIQKQKPQFVDHFSNKLSLNKPKIETIQEESEINASPTKINEEDEAIVMEPPQKKKPTLTTGNTGSTGDVMFDSSSDHSQNKKIESNIKPGFKKPKKFNLNLAIDTEAINDLFTYGGEKGEIKQTTEEEQDQMEADIAELASICVAAMRKGKAGEVNQDTLWPKTILPNKAAMKQSFNEPQTVRGIKHIHISDQKEDKQNKTANLQNIQQQLSIIEESPKNQSAISSQAAQTIVNSQLQSEFNMVNSNENNDINNQQQKLDTQAQVDSYTQDLENLYTSCLEWILNRAPSGLFKNLVIDDYDKINFQPALQILMTLVTYSNNLVRQRALQDMFMLAHWESSNGQIILQYPQFHIWLLKLLMPYQNLIANNSQLTDSSRAVYDMGCKLHSLLLKNACLNPEENAFKKINALTRWPHVCLINQTKSTDQEYQKANIETAHSTVRVLLVGLINSLRDEANNSKPSLKLNSSISWRNLIHLTLQVEELMLSSHNKEFKETNSSDINNTLLHWLQKDYLLYYNDSPDPSMWAEWDVCEALLKTLDSFFPLELKVKPNNETYNDPSFEIEQSAMTLMDLGKTDQFSSELDILLYEAQTSFSGQQQQQQTTSSHLPSFHPFGNSKQQQNQKDNQLGGQTFMRALMNIICVCLSQSNTKELVQVWIERLEVFVKFLCVISESLNKSQYTKQKNPQFSYATIQQKFAEVITFALTFIFNQIHETNSSPTSQATQNAQSLYNTKDIQLSKIYQQTLKNLMVFCMTVVQYNNSKSQNNKELSACNMLMKEILVKQYAQGSQEPLITASDLIKFKQSTYEDFPECFFFNDWKVTFFHNKAIKKIINKQLNVQILEQLMSRMKQYAQHCLEVETRTDKAKEQILNMIQADTLEAVMLLSEDEFERKNKDYLLIESFNTDKLYHNRQYSKTVKGIDGMWRDDIPTFQRLTNSLSGFGMKNIMKDTPSNGFVYIENEQLEKKIFHQVYNRQTNEFVESEENVVEEEEKKDQQQAIKFSDEEESVHTEDEDVTPHHKQISPQQKTENESILVNHIQHFTRKLSDREKNGLKKTYINYLKEEILSQNSKEKELLNFPCQILKSLYKKTGVMVMTNVNLIFFDELISKPDPATQNIFFFNYKKKEHSKLYKIYPLYKIKEIQRRQFLGRKTSLEIFMLDNSSLLLNFDSTDNRSEFSKTLIKQRKLNCKNLRYHQSLDSRRILKRRNLTEDWLNWKLSNFDYLMHLNQLAGRSYNDLSQYPVFPWILTNYTSNKAPNINNATATSIGSAAPDQFRDLSRNMQLLGTAERQAEFKRKYEDADSFMAINDRFHCGSHYSNPGIVLHYMTRLHPYVDANVELHGKSLDNPDRVFCSLEESFYNALNDFSDVRELTPEHYYMPELFLNKNQVNFGTRQNGQKVNDVILPSWARNDPYKFVMYLREAFESPYVSQSLHLWIDYIFGYKQRDQDAVNSLNTFSALTYTDGGFDIESVQDSDMKQSYILQIYNYGQTPSQLFKANEKHPMKNGLNQGNRFNLVIDNVAKLKVYKPVTQPQGSRQNQQNSSTSRPLICNEAILKAKFTDDQKIVGASKEGYALNFIWWPRAHELNPTTPFTLGQDKKKKYDTKHINNHFDIDMVDRSLKRFDFPILIMNQGKTIVKGGFWDGKILFSPVEGSNDKQTYIQGHSQTVSAIVCDSKERIIISGSKLGDVIVWVPNDASNDDVDKKPWVVSNHFCHHERQISYIFIDEGMNLLATSSFDGTVNLYNLWNQKHYRKFEHPTLAPIHTVVLSSSPLASLCFFSREDHLWHSFSINGHQLTSSNQEEIERQKTMEECSHVISPVVAKDTFSQDKLIYGTEKGFLILRKLPSLIPFKRLQVSNNFPVLTINISPDRRFLHVACGDGGLIIITEPIGARPQSNTLPPGQNRPSTATIASSQGTTGSSQQHSTPGEQTMTSMSSPMQTETSLNATSLQNSQNSSMQQKQIQQKSGMQRLQLEK